MKLIALSSLFVIVVYVSGYFFPTAEASPVHFATAEDLEDEIVEVIPLNTDKDFGCFCFPSTSLCGAFSNTPTMKDYPDTARLTCPILEFLLTGRSVPRYDVVAHAAVENLFGIKCFMENQDCLMYMITYKTPEYDSSMKEIFMKALGEMATPCKCIV